MNLHELSINILEIVEHFPNELSINNLESIGNFPNKFERIIDSLLTHFSNAYLS